MQLQNFECQIANAQIGRFVAGDALSDEALQQLEAHIAGCAVCKQNLAERRALLQAMAPTEAIADNSARSTPAQTRSNLAQLIRSKLMSGQQVQAAVQGPMPRPSNFTRPTLYSLALGAVLIGMSYVSRNMDSVLGPKADEPTKTGLPQSTNVVMTKGGAAGYSAPRATRPPVTPVKPKQEPNWKPADAQATRPGPKPMGAPTHQPNSSSRSQDATKPGRHRPAHEESNTIRVYEPEN